MNYIIKVSYRNYHDKTQFLFAYPRIPLVCSDYANAPLFQFEPTPDKNDSLHNIPYSLCHNKA